MKPTLNAVFILAVLALTMIACQPAAKQALPSPLPPTPTGPAAATPESLAALIRPTVTPIDWNSTGSDQPAQTATPRTVDLSEVRIAASELQGGFEELDAASQAKIGLTQESLAAFYDGAFSQATAQNYFALINADPASFEVALGLLFSPLTQTEKTAFDAELADKNQAIQHFAENFNGKADLIPSSDPIGEKSVGFTFLSDAGTLTMRGDLWIVRNQNVVMLVMVLYQDGKEPPVQAALVASLLNAKLKMVLNP